jgi:hypothetical protein
VPTFASPTTSSPPSYLTTVFQALEDRFECWLLNAHHLRNVPGRKDSEWICQLVHGLVRPSFVPPPEIRRLRDLTRLRTAQGDGRRTIAARLDRPPGTVRGWLRAGARRADALTLRGVRWTVALGDELGRPTLPDSPLHGAVDALGRAVIACKLRFYDPRVSPWELMVALTGGGLLHGRPRDPPGY